MTLDIDPNLAVAWYGRSCTYSLIEKKEVALFNLKRAIELDGYYKGNAKTDNDFKMLWEDDEFKKLVE